MKKEQTKLITVEITPANPLIEKVSVRQMHQ